MEILSKMVLILCLLIFSSTMATRRAPRKNRLILERLICPPNESDRRTVESIYCHLKRVSRTHIKIDIRVNLSHPVNNLWIHSVFYHKFNGISFQKFPIDLWENVCDWLSGKSHSYVMDWAFSPILNYTHFNHTCPIYDIITKAESIPMDTFTFEQSFIPSGSYRVDNDLCTTKEGSAIIKASLYFSVSDHRLEKI